MASPARSTSVSSRWSQAAQRKDASKWRGNSVIGRYFVDDNSISLSTALGSAGSSIFLRLGKLDAINATLVVDQSLEATPPYLTDKMLQKKRSKLKAYGVVAEKKSSQHSRKASFYIPQTIPRPQRIRRVVHWARPSTRSSISLEIVKCQEIWRSCKDTLLLGTFDKEPKSRVGSKELRK